MLWLHGHILTVTIFLPLVGAVAIGLVPRGSTGRIRTLALVFSLLTFLAALVLFFGFDRAQPAMQFVEDYAWISWPPIHYHLGIDGLSMIPVSYTHLTLPTKRIV